MRHPHALLTARELVAAAVLVWATFLAVALAMPPASGEVTTPPHTIEVAR